MCEANIVALSHFWEITVNFSDKQRPKIDLKSFFVIFYKEK